MPLPAFCLLLQAMREMAVAVDALLCLLRLTHPRPRAGNQGAAVAQQQAAYVCWSSAGRLRLVRAPRSASGSTAAPQRPPSLPSGQGGRRGLGCANLGDARSKPGLVCPNCQPGEPCCELIGRLEACAGSSRTRCLLGLEIWCQLGLLLQPAAPQGVRTATLQPLLLPCAFLRLENACSCARSSARSLKPFSTCQP